LPEAFVDRLRQCSNQGTKRERIWERHCPPDSPSRVSEWCSLVGRLSRAVRGGPDGSGEPSYEQAAWLLYSCGECGGGCRCLPPVPPVDSGTAIAELRPGPGGFTRPRPRTGGREPPAERKWKAMRHRAADTPEDEQAFRVLIVDDNRDAAN